MKLSAILLAGGEGRRMGHVNKAHLTLHGERFIDRQLAVVADVVDERIVVVNDASKADEFSSLPPDVRVVLDCYPGEGPLAGIQAGLEAAEAPFAWVIGCDQPLIDAEAAKLLLTRLEEGDYDAALPIIGGRPQPLHAVYRAEVGLIAARLLAAGNRKLMSLLEELTWIGVEEIEFEAHGIARTFSDDVDTPEQYDTLVRMKEQP